MLKEWRVVYFIPRKNLSFINELLAALKNPDLSSDILQKAGCTTKAEAEEKMMKPQQLLPFVPSEVQHVYLGCRIKENDKQDILQIVKEKYPWAKISQMKKKKTSFDLDSEEIQL